MFVHAIVGASEFVVERQRTNVKPISNMLLEAEEYQFDERREYFLHIESKAKEGAKYELWKEGTTTSSATP